jgi:UDP-N-acetylmuramyl pentapeptide phosphotransferase/UDP-N-acetylglucosamine-1-phosphate transferase
MPLAQPALWGALLVAGCAGLSALLILVLKPLLVRYLLARPNARSSHQIATPQGAGLAVMLSVLAGCALGLLLWVQEPRPSLIPVLAIAAGLTILGALDDAHALPVSWRLIGQMLASLILVMSLPEGFQLFPDLMPLVVERALMMLGIVWFVNAVNFLDGLDWMTVAQVVPMTLGIAVLEALGAVPASVGLLALALLGATFGFAIFNKHPAQVFLGDAGSLPIGFLLAFMLIFVADAHLVAALLLSLYTLADATLTLLRRLAAGERISSAHRTHFYQRAVAQGLSVPQVTARIFALELLLACLAITTVLARSLTVDLLCLGLGLLATGFTLFALARGR